MNEQDLFDVVGEACDSFVTEAISWKSDSKKKSKIQKGYFFVGISVAILLALFIRFGLSNADKPLTATESKGGGEFFSTIGDTPSESEVQYGIVTKLAEEKETVIFRDKQYKYVFDFQIEGNGDAMLDGVIGRADLLGTYGDETVRKIDEETNGNGNAYTLQGYRDDFRIAILVSAEETGDRKQTVIRCYDRIDHLLFCPGSDLFEECLHLQDKAQMGKSRSIFVFDGELNQGREMDLSEDDWKDFLNAIDHATIGFQGDAKPFGTEKRKESEREICLVIQLNDGTKSFLRVEENGNVGLLQFPGYSVRISEEVVKSFFQ